MSRRTGAGDAPAINGVGANFTGVVGDGRIGDTARARAGNARRAHVLKQLPCFVAVVFEAPVGALELVAFAERVGAALAHARPTDANLGRARTVAARGHACTTSACKRVGLIGLCVATGCKQSQYGGLS